MNEKKVGGFEKIDQMIVRAVKFVSIGAGICLVAIMLIAFFNVLGERILHHGIPSSMEWIQNLHVPVVFLAAAYVTLDQGHTRIDLLCKRFPAAIQKIFTTVGFLIGTFICGFVGYASVSRLTKSIANREHANSTASSPLVWPFVLILIIGFVALSVSFLWSIVRLYVKKDTPEVEEKEVADHE